MLFVTYVWNKIVACGGYQEFARYAKSTRAQLDQERAFLDQGKRSSLDELSSAVEAMAEQEQVVFLL